MRPRRSIAGGGLSGSYDGSIELACENPASRVFNQMTGQMSVRDIAGTALVVFPGDVTIGTWRSSGRGARGVSHRLSADPNLTRAIRPGGECHLEPE
jgi:hypothetical protein